MKGKLFWRGESECKGPGVGASAIIWGTNKQGGGGAGGKRSGQWWQADASERSWVGPGEEFVIYYMQTGKPWEVESEGI